MPLSTPEHRYSRREHALWRVQFRRSLLLTHRATRSASPDWIEKEAEFELWLQEALDAWREPDFDDKTPLYRGLK
jgi:hypothetical protein